jgi:hypothetical protein
LSLQYSTISSSPLAGGTGCWAGDNDIGSNVGRWVGIDDTGCCNVGRLDVGAVVVGRSDIGTRVIGVDVGRFDGITFRVGASDGKFVGRFDTGTLVGSKLGRSVGDIIGGIAIGAGRGTTTGPVFTVNGAGVGGGGCGENGAIIEGVIGDLGS